MDMTTAHLLDSLGWAVIHSLWQGALAALAVFIFRAATKDRQANLRCGFELLALGLCFFAFTFTFASNFLAPTSTQAVLPVFVDMAALPVSAGAPSIGASEVLATQAKSMVQYTPLLGIFWCLGFLLLALRYSVGFAMTHRLRTRGLSDAPQRWQNRFETLVLNSGIFRTVTLHVSNRVAGPITLGFFKPVVLVPASFFSGLPAEQIEAILMHEIAHIRRHDYLINLAQTAMKTILFYHPAIHYICRSIDEDREKACDDFAVNYTKNPAALVKGLATIRLNLAAPNFAPPNFSMAASSNRNPLLRRLTRLTAPEESRRRPGQVITTVAALLVAAGIYTTTNVQFANAHTPEPEATNLTDNLHVSADEKNYHFSTIWHNGREIAIKTAEDGSRWVSFKNSWFNIDKNPEILDAVPAFPDAPKMPYADKYPSDHKFQKAVNQYRVSLDYYIESLKILDQSKEVKSDLHWAKKQQAKVSKPGANLEKDLLWNGNTPPNPTPHPQAKPVPTPNPKPQPIVFPAPPAKPVIKTAELAGASKTQNNSFYLKGETYDAESWEQKNEDQIDRIADKFEHKMDSVDREFERALETFEHATEKFARDPISHKDYFERAQSKFATSVLAANSKRASLQVQLDHDINEAVDSHVHQMTSHIQSTVQNETEKALDIAFKQAEMAQKRHETSAKAEHKAHSYSDHGKGQSYTSHPTYDTYGQVILAQLGNDGLIPHGSTAVDIQYKDGDMYVNGKIVNDDTSDNYCSINKAFNVTKSDNMRIEVMPERLTITDYNY